MAENSELSVIKCPSCGADMVFDPGAGALSCPYCGGTKSVEKRVTSLRDFMLERTEGEVEEGSTEYECPNCGGKVTLENYATTEECPYCGATNIIKKERLKGLKPDSILPFCVTRDAAFASGKKWLKKKIFAPTKLKRNFKVDKFKGIYEPSFIFAANTLSDYDGKLGEDYYVTVRRGKNTVTERRTRWFHVAGNLQRGYRDIVVEASSNLDQKQMEKLLPFDLNTAEQYKREYLAGFAAERYNESLDDSFTDAKGIMEEDIRAAILSQYHYDRVAYLNVNTHYNDIKFNYILLPVWVCGYKFRDKIWSFLVNGRTGKATGKVPVSVPKAVFTAIFAAAVIGVLVWLIFFSGLL